MSLKEFFVKWTLASCYRQRGIDYEKEARADGNATYIETENYAVRQQRYSWPDVVITKKGILVYSYHPDPREHPYKCTPLLTLREFLKERQHAQIRSAGNQVSQSKRIEVVKEYLIRKQRRGSPQLLDVEPHIDWERYSSAGSENERWIEQSIAHIDEYIANSFRIRLASWVVGL